MRSSLPKVLHPVAGRPMIEHVLQIARALDSVATAVVLAPDSADVRECLGDVLVVEQTPQLGTGHAVLQARARLAERSEQVLVLYGDTPLLRPSTAGRLLDELGHATLAILTAQPDDPRGYGRVVRDGGAGQVLRVVEEAEANDATLALREINSGVMAVQAEWLWEQLTRLTQRPNGEYYLTDLVRLAVADGRPVAAVCTDQPTEAFGINTQAQLADANRVAWDRVNQRLMDDGVTIVDPRTVYVEASVEVGSGSLIHPNTHLAGATMIGRDCEIGPNSQVLNSQIGDGARIWASVVEGSVLGDRVVLGPFSHVRPGCRIEPGVQLGNFAEAKSSRIGPDTQMHHFGYLGDAVVGAGVNIGAGTVTCNYDGQDKHRTIIGDQAFVGSGSMLVAPVRIGDRSRTGAGSVVTRDVDEETTVVGMPARPTRKPKPDGAQPKDGE